MIENIFEESITIDHMNWRIIFLRQTEGFAIIISSALAYELEPL